MRANGLLGQAADLGQPQRAGLSSSRRICKAQPHGAYVVGGFLPLVIVKALSKLEDEAASFCDRKLVLRDNVCSDNHVKPSILADRRRLLWFKLVKPPRGVGRSGAPGVAAHDPQPHYMSVMQARSEPANHSNKSSGPKATLTNYVVTNACNVCTGVEERTVLPDGKRSSLNLW